MNKLYPKLRENNKKRRRIYKLKSLRVYNSYLDSYNFNEMIKSFVSMVKIEANQAPEKRFKGFCQIVT